MAPGTCATDIQIPILSFLNFWMHKFFGGSSELESRSLRLRKMTGDDTALNLDAGPQSLSLVMEKLHAWEEKSPSPKRRSTKQIQDCITSLSQVHSLNLAFLAISFSIDRGLKEQGLYALYGLQGIFGDMHLRVSLKLASRSYTGFLALEQSKCPCGANCVYKNV